MGERSLRNFVFWYMPRIPLILIRVVRILTWNICFESLSLSLSIYIYIKCWWRHQLETYSALLALCAGNIPVTGEFSSQRSVTRSFEVFFDPHSIKRLSKQSRCRWFGTPSRSLLWPSQAIWQHISWSTLVHCTGLLLGGTKPLPAPILTCRMVFGPSHESNFRKAQEMYTWNAQDIHPWY